MKRVFALALALILSLSACGGPGGGDAQSGDLDIDMSVYPADLNEWTGQTFIDYFTEAGVFGTKNNGESWLQDHIDYWPQTPVSECAGWWDDANNMVMILLLTPDNADSSQEQYDEWMTAIRDTKALPGDYATVTVDHLIGNVAFGYETTVLDDGIYARMNAAYQNLADSLGVTPEF